MTRARLSRLLVVVSLIAGAILVLVIATEFLTTGAEDCEVCLSQLDCQLPENHFDTCNTTMGCTCLQCPFGSGVWKCVASSE